MIKDLSLKHILFLAVLLRVIWALLIPVIPVSDSAAYDTFAMNIWLHGTYGWEPDKPYSYWPVGTSAIYSLIYFLFGHAYSAIVVLNCALSVGIIYFSKKLIDQFFDQNTGLLCALLLAIWPTGITLVTILGSELLYMFFSITGAYLFFTHSRQPKRHILIGLSVGLCFAIAYYVRPMVTVPFVICIFVALVVQKQKSSAVGIKSLLIILVMVICVAPWAWRNYQVHNAFVPMSTNSGAVFWMGNQPGTTGGYLPTPPEMRDMDTHLRSQILKQQAMDYIKAEPIAFITRTLYKLVKFHSYETIGITWNEKGIEKTLGAWAIFPLKLMTHLFWLAMVTLAAAGLVIMLWQRGFWTLAFNPLFLFWASSAAIHSLIVSQDRYHLPSAPFVFAFSAVTIIAAINQYQARKMRLTDT